MRAILQEGLDKVTKPPDPTPEPKEATDTDQENVDETQPLHERKKSDETQPLREPKKSDETQPLHEPKTSDDGGNSDSVAVTENPTDDPTIRIILF